MYFERRLRTSHITPLRLDICDAQIAIDVFVAYWIKATQYQQFGDAIEIQPEQVRSESKQVIEALYKNQ